MHATTQTVKVYATPPHACSYLPDRMAVNAFLDPTFTPAPVTYQNLIDRGYRRSGDHLYRPACEACHECLSCRVSSHRFLPNRSQRRCWRRNGDLQVTIRPAAFSEEAFDLYRRYLDARHADGDMANPSQEDFEGFLFAEWSNTQFIEFRLGNRLLSVAVADRLPQGYSAVYTFFDPAESQRSLGTYAVLWQLEHAKLEGLPFVYLGYWIEHSPKMRYKSRFRPLEVLRDGRWQPLAPSAPATSESDPEETT